MTLREKAVRSLGGRCVDCGKGPKAGLVLSLIDRRKWPGRLATRPRGGRLYRLVLEEDPRVVGVVSVRCLGCLGKSRGETLRENHELTYRCATGNVRHQLAGTCGQSRPCARQRRAERRTPQW